MNYIQRLTQSLQSLRPSFLIGTSGLAMLSAATFLALLPDSSPAALAALLSGVGGNVLAGLLQQLFERVRDIPASHQQLQLKEIAQAISPFIEEQPQLRVELGKFLDDNDAFAIAKAIAEGDPATHGWLLINIYDNLVQYRQDFDDIHIKLSDIEKAVKQLEVLEEIKQLLKDQRNGLSFFPQFKTPIENFLISYLGTDKEPVPFGGRDEQLAQLEQWRSHSSRQRLLLVAPAGRGKSALLVRWSQKLVNRDDVAVLFMPISARFGTNRDDVTFACLAVRLAHLYGKEIPTDFAHFTPNLWRGLVADYLREPLPNGRQLLVILDGLDEAAWDGYEDIFPLQLPSSIRLVVSARYRAGEAVSPRPWLQRLGWDRFTELAATLALPELTLDGVRDVLVKMGCPLDELGSQVNIVSELYRLSEGDPLLVELYVKDLWAKGASVTRLKPEDLEKIKPGYKGFFDKWWGDQEKLWGREKPLLQNMTRTLLNLLATAWGPLLLDDLLAILATDPLVDGFHIQEAIKPLSRFVLGDGREQGYVFAHPRLIDYFWDGLGHREQGRWEEFFIGWGQTTVKQLEDNLLRYEDVSLYLLQYYTSHLRRRESPLDSYLSLLSHQWMQAWHKKTGTYTGFLRDVDQVWGKLAQANKEAIAQEKVAPFLGKEIRCALYHTSVHSLAENLSDDLLVQLLNNGIWTEVQVVAYARHKHNPIARCRTLMQIAFGLSRQQSKEIQIEIIEAASAVKEEWSRAEVLITLAPYMPEEVLTAARVVRDEWFRGRVLAALAPHLPQEVLMAAGVIRDERSRAHVLVSLAAILPQEVLTAASVMKDDESQAEVLVALTPHLPEEQQVVTLTTALTAASVVKDGWSRTRVLAALASRLPHEVLKATSTLEYETSRVTVLSSLAPYLPQEVLTIASTLKDKGACAQVFTALAPHLPEEQQAVTLTAVLSAANTLEYEEARARVLAALAPHMPQEVLKACSAIQYERSRAELLIVLAPHMPQEVLMATYTVKDEWSRAEVLIALASHLSAEVLTAARAIRDEWFRARVLDALAPHLPQQVLTAVSVISSERSRAEVLITLTSYLPQEVLIAACAIKDDESRAEVLSALVPYLPQEQKVVTLTAALKAASAIKDDESQVEVLSALAPHLPQDVLTATSAIENERYRVELLTALAPYLPQKVLMATRDISYERSRVDLLIALAPHLPQDVLVAASAVKHEEFRARVLTALAPHLPQEVLAATRDISYERSRVDLLTALAPYLPQEVLVATSAIKYEEYLARVLIALAPHFSREQQVAIRVAALTATKTVNNEWFRAGVLTDLAPCMPRKVLRAASNFEDEELRIEVLTTLAPYLPQKVLIASGTLKYERSRAEVFTALASHLSHEVLMAASTIKYEGFRARVLVALASYLPQEVLASASVMVDEESRAHVLTAVIPHLPQEQQAFIRNTALTAAKAVEDDESQAKILTALSSYLPQEVLTVSGTLKVERARAEVLTALAPHLPQKVLTATSEIPAEEIRSQVLIALAPYLPQEVLKASRGVRYEKSRAEVLTALAPHLPQKVLKASSVLESKEERVQIIVELNDTMLSLSRPRLYSSWQDFIQVSASRSRHHLLSDIASCFPIIKQLGGQEALLETVEALKDVTVWWQ